MTEESKDNKNKKAASAWHQVLVWMEILFTVVIAWTTYLLPEIQLAVAESIDPETLLDWKNSQILRSVAIAVVYIIFLLAFNLFYVFLLKPTPPRKRMIMIYLPIFSLILVILAGFLGTHIALK